MCIPIHGVVEVLVYGVFWVPHRKKLTWMSKNQASPHVQSMCFISVWRGFLDTETQLLIGYIVCGVLVKNTTVDSELGGYMQQSINN